MEIPLPFYCLRLKGCALTDELRRVLLRTAWEMIEGEQTRQEVGGREHSYEGLIATRKIFASVGGLSGMVFYATICSNDCGEVEVDYLAPPSVFKVLCGGAEEDDAPDATAEEMPVGFRPELN